ncbi:hypothetical protein [Staphylococcus delphini]|uniref:hypothetical protein n=1 Tax=Staphylococcus delphini TaxID=53344 RepID=UPI0018AD5D46|nr:hypothetical protein [Staphylococcus delphini]
MKIKTKKEMTLPELIQWAWENDVRDKSYFSENSMRGVSFDSDGKVSFYFPKFATQHIRQNSIFTVEVEEEITEETVISMVLEVCEYCDGSLNAGLRRECSIKEALDDNELYGHYNPCILHAQ